MGTTDATKENPEISCNGHNGAIAMAILDFAEPTYLGNNVYGVRTFGFINLNYSQVQTVVENYINAWLASASSCIGLAVVIGISTYIMCPFDRTNACYHGSGYALEQTASTLDGVYGGNILVVGGADIEVDANWDDFAEVQQMVQGYNAAGSYALYDYGDTCIYVSNSDECKYNGSDWTPCNVYYAAWGYGLDQPVPEIYSANFAWNWAYLYNTESKSCSTYGSAGPMQFQGIANATFNGYSWQQAYSDFRSDVGSSAVIGVADTCFPPLSDKYPIDSCYP